MKENKFKEFLEQYLNDSLPPGEVHAFIRHLMSETNDHELKTALTNALNEEGNYTMSETTNYEKEILIRILKKATEQTPELSSFKNDTSSYKNTYKILKVAVAAAVVVALFAIGVRHITPAFLHRQESHATHHTNSVKDFNAAENKALLTLADGRTIVLDSAGNGQELALQGSTKIIKQQNGQIAYICGSGAASEEMLYNTIAVPRNGKFQILLRDGTRVWLNALSTLRFPTAFSPTERRVTLTGEAYFEVAKNTAKPFIVNANATEVKVLGTQFNLNAYADESAVTTTLVEGSVKVSKNHQSVTIKPGQEARVAKSIDVAPADVEAAIAWKEDRFFYNNAPLKIIMRQLEKWYDIQTQFDDPITDTYTISMSREVPISKVLEYITLSGGVQFKIQGKKVIVKNK